MSPVEPLVSLKAENFLYLESEQCGREVKETQRFKGVEKHDPPLLEGAP